MRTLLLLARVTLASVLLFCGSVLTHAQESAAELPARARDMGLTLALPSLEKLRFDTSLHSRNRQRVDMGWLGRAHRNFEIYVSLVPEDGSPLFPNILGGAAATNAARNSDEEEDFMALYRAGDEDLRRLNADWAAFWAFTPKEELSRRRYGYQATYYKQGRGLVHVWVLADDREVVNGDWAYVLPFAVDASRL